MPAPAAAQASPFRVGQAECIPYPALISLGPGPSAGAGDVGAPTPRYVSQRKPRTPKRQWRDNSQSLYGRPFDPLKDGELNVSIPGHEGNGENVWKYFKEEEIDEKEQLVNMIDDFHSQYLSLYRRYDHLIEALRKKAGSKHGTDSLSSGAYFSDSDDSPAKHRAANNGAPEKSPEKDIDGVLQEFEMALGEVTELMIKLAVTTREKDALHQENANALSKLQEAQKIVTALNAEAEKWNNERSRLLTENADLKAELVSYRNSQAEFNQKPENKDAVGYSLKEVGSINGRLQLERDTMQLKLESVRGESSILRERLEVAENELAKQNQIRLASKQEKLELSSKISHLEEEIKHKESKIQELESVKEENSILRRKLEFAANEIMKQSQIHKQQAAQLEKTVLSSRISQLQEEIKQKENKIQVLVTESNRLSEELALKERETPSHLIENSEAHKEAEKDGMDGLLSQLDDKESEILMLREKVWKLENKLRELEKNTKEKEETILGCQEEKREAIRQLCVWIDHHRNRSDYYKKRLLEMNSNRETQISVG